MIRGTTPTLEFKIPFAALDIAELYVTLAQRKTVILDKGLGDCAVEDNKVTLRLTQEDTLQLKGELRTDIQLRIRTTSGNAFASDIISVSTYDILKDGVI